jgi:hypothetical protein
VATSEAKAALERDPADGELFWWLYDNYAWIKRIHKRRKRVNWRELEKRCVQLELTDRRGNAAPTQKTLRKTFGRVDEMKGREAELSAERRRTRPKPGPPPVAQPKSASSRSPPAATRGPRSVDDGLRPAAARSNPGQRDPIEDHPLMQEFRRKSRY